MQIFVVVVVRMRSVFDRIDVIRTPVTLCVNPWNNCLIAINTYRLFVLHEKLRICAPARNLRNNNERRIYSTWPHVYLRKGGFT